MGTGGGRGGNRESGPFLSIQNDFAGQFDRIPRLAGGLVMCITGFIIKRYL